MSSAFSNPILYGWFNEAFRDEFKNIARYTFNKKRARLCAYVINTYLSFSFWTQPFRSALKFENYCKKNPKQILRLLTAQPILTLTCGALNMTENFELDFQPNLWDFAGYISIFLKPLNYKYKILQKLCLKRDVVNRILSQKTCWN